eukprot:CAMPEP_0184857644 /NCGR_PEP_ID=MMETSP0580-20130426/2794_1 /TAXON_ID=1118495 /ORGANISM="Dactyliosolen fragilissimus" /LENGTH=1231 /DNA_ID=CAMNT_0027353355 /DNA_START=166 /DNA_END=3861 /DNA_ORIENTATION=-
MEDLNESITKLEYLVELTVANCRQRSSLSLNKRNNDENSISVEEEDARFIAMSLPHEEEIIELLRRIAELVVRSDRRAAVAARLQNADPSRNIIDSPPNQLFDHFCERNTLSLIVNIVTGISFKNAAAASANKYNTTKLPILLPPLSITTQGIQSVSILLQNVSRETSLYFLLSNHRVNDLIKFPLHLYEAAEKVKHGQQHAVTSPSGEISELTTHYISFLKSLAMRMNSETLQFFLEYSTDSPEKDKSIEEHVQFPLYERALQFCSQEQDSFVRITAMNICLNTLRLITYNDTDSKHINISSNHSTEDLPVNEKDQSQYIVNETHIVGGSFGLHGEITIHSKTNNNIKNENGKVPDGTLHHAKSLPFRERLAIAQHVCVPSRVKALLSPVFNKLVELFQSLQGTIRSLDDIGHSISQQTYTNKNKEEIFQQNSQEYKNVDNILLDIDRESQIKEESESRLELERNHSKHCSTFRNILANLEDELLLLEDVFNVGLTSFNEQAIEMMLVCVVYPLLLQPLHLAMQQHQSPTNIGLVSNPDFEKKSTHSNPLPSFTPEDISNGTKTSESPLKVEQPTEHTTAESDNDTVERKTLKIEWQRLDRSSAKTSLFGISSIFQTLSHEPFLQILATAIYHPLCVEIPDDSILSQPPVIVTTDSNANEIIRVDSRICPSKSSETENSLIEHNPYDFTKYISIKKENEGGRIENNNECTFVLSPALTCAMKGDFTLIQSTKPNPYRRAALACLSGTDGMSQLQSLAIYTIDSVVSSLSPEILKEAIFGSNTSLNNEMTTESKKDTVELMTSLCECVVTASVTKNDIWGMSFNAVASHVLLCIIMDNDFARETCSKLINHRICQSALFLTKFPSRLKIRSPSRDRSQKKDRQIKSNQLNRQEQNVITDRFFFDPLLKGESILERVLSNRDGLISNCGNKIGHVSISYHSSLIDICNYICGPRFYQNIEPKEDFFCCGAKSVLSHLQLDSLSTFIQDNISNGLELNSGLHDPVAFALKKRYEGLLNKGDRCHQTFLYHISDKYSSILFGDIRNEESVPQSGSIVTLVGKAAFPCVCEVDKESQSLFTDESACVVSEGVKWQSLYLVLLGKNLILAEPERAGSGGNGRVVTACRLVSLHAEKDNLGEIENASPARRLILTHSSPNPKIPGVFTQQKKEINQDAPDQSTVKISRMDLWFEDENAANHAFKVLRTRIAKARSKRGQELQNALGFSSNPSESSLS